MPVSMYNSNDISERQSGLQKCTTYRALQTDMSAYTLVITKMFMISVEKQYLV